MATEGSSASFGGPAHGQCSLYDSRPGGGGRRGRAKGTRSPTSTTLAIRIRLTFPFEDKPGSTLRHACACGDRGGNLF